MRKNMILMITLNSTMSFSSQKCKSIILINLKEFKFIILNFFAILVNRHIPTDISTWFARYSLSCYFGKMGLHEDIFD